jgi:hypothetical protein
MAMSRPPKPVRYVKKPIAGQEDKGVQTGGERGLTEPCANSHPSRGV